VDWTHNVIRLRREKREQAVLTCLSFSLARPQAPNARSSFGDTLIPGRSVFGHPPAEHYKHEAAVHIHDATGGMVIIAQ
jgi:hypothetical protein